MIPNMRKARIMNTNPMKTEVSMLEIESMFRELAGSNSFRKLMKLDMNMLRQYSCTKRTE